MRFRLPTRSHLGGLYIGYPQFRDSISLKSFGVPDLLSPQSLVGVGERDGAKLGPLDFDLTRCLNTRNPDVRNQSMHHPPSSRPLAVAGTVLVMHIRSGLDGVEIYARRNLEP